MAALEALQKLQERHEQHPQKYKEFQIGDNFFFFFFLIQVYTPSCYSYECYRHATTSYYRY
jgi:hypothetical protein